MNNIETQKINQHANKKAMNLQLYTNRGGEKRLVPNLGEHGHGKRLGKTLINAQRKKKRGRISLANNYYKSRNQHSLKTINLKINEPV